MKTNDLRIGNYIYGNYYGNEDEEKTEKCKVLGIDSVGFSEYPIWVEGLEETGIETYMGFEPIPLTEEWLLKFGGIKDVEGVAYIKLYKGYDLRLYIVANGVQETKGISTPFSNFTHIKHVHQLQNLYHALTGEEL